MNGLINLTGYSKDKNKGQHLPVNIFLHFKQSLLEIVICRVTYRVDKDS